MANDYARGFRASNAAAKRLLHEMADELDDRTAEDSFAGKPPSTTVRKLRLAAQRIGALDPNIARSRSGIPITKGRDDVGC